MDKDGKKHKAQGGTRTMYMAHNPCWDAKNRWGVKEELPFSFSEISAFIPGIMGKTMATTSYVPEPTKEPVSQPVQQSIEMPKEETKQTETLPQQSVPPTIPKALADLMNEHFVTVEEIQDIVSERGYYPKGTPIENYDSGFITGVLIGAWPQVFEMIEANRKTVEREF